MDKRWKNQLLFPFIIGLCFLYFLLLKSFWFLLLISYFIFMISYKKQVVLGLLSLFVVFCFSVRVIGYRMQTLPPIERPLTVEMTLFPDTIQVKDTFITMEGRLPQGDVFIQYSVNTIEEAEEWRIRANQNKQIQAQGFFKKAENARNLHGFNRQWYGWTQNKIGTFFIEKITSERPNTKWLIGRHIRSRMIDWTEKTFPVKLAVYIKALLFGYRDQGFQEIREIYNSSGILHLFSISGMHIGIFFGWCFAFFRRSRLTFEEFVLPFILLMFFLVFLFGQGLSIWRGALMYLVNFICKEKQIRLSACDRFSIALFFLLLIEPKSFLQLSGILSILLSFILLMSNEFQKNSLIYSIEISLLASPILMYFFYEIPLLGGLLTALIAPFFALFLLPALVFLCFLNLLPIPSLVLSLFMIKLLTLFENLLAFSRYFIVITGKPSLLFVLSSLILGLACYPFIKWRRLYFSLLFCLLLFPRFPLQSSVSFVDVGQGDSLVFQSIGNRQVYVVDTGGKINYFSSDEGIQQKNASYTLIPFLKGEGIRKIDGLFLTHGDFDHMGDVEELLKTFKIQTIYLSEGTLQHKNMVNLMMLIPKKTRVVELKAGEKVGTAPIFEVLAPLERGTGENKDSLVLKTQVKGISFLLMGDLEKEGEERLIRTYPKLNADILKLGHHGSKTSTTAAFLNLVQPKQAIISCGVKNQFKHPHPEVLENLQKEDVQIFRTDAHGMIRYEWRMNRKMPTIRKLKTETFY